MRIDRLTYDLIDSTNQEARRLGASEMLPGWPERALVLTARGQRDGRGRHGRSWHAPRGGAWFTIAWPMRNPPEHYAAVPLLAGLAAAEGINLTCKDGGLTCRPIRIKWPNDLLLEGAKVGGILCQTCPLVPDAEGEGRGDGSGPANATPPASDPAAAGDTPTALLIGIGINVNLSAAMLPTSTDAASPQPTSLRIALGAEVDVETLIDEVCDRLCCDLARLDGLGNHDPLPLAMQRINARLAWRGQPVRLIRCGRGDGGAGDAAGQEVRGVIERVDERGRLLLATDAGTIAVDAGEVERLRSDAPTTDQTPVPPDGAAARPPTD